MENISMIDKNKCVVCGERFETMWDVVKHEFKHTIKEVFDL